MMKELKCLVVDDEPLAIDVVANFLARLDITDITRCGNGIEAFQWLQQQKFDLLFLDIEMPMINGIDLVKSLPYRPAVVITTAFRDYAVEGFELEVLDYLVKPFSFARFMRTMEKFSRAGNVAAIARAERRAAGKSVDTGKTADAGESHAAGSGAVGEKKEVTGQNENTEGCLFLKVDRQLIKVAIRDILYIGSRKDYIRVNTTKGEWLCHQSLSDITAKLPAEKFFRLHRSYTVALDKIDKFRNNNVHIGGKVLPVSRENRQELRRRLQ
jgi:DNA-binding LytR/AlgR family response regulator